MILATEKIEAHRASWRRWYHRNKHNSKSWKLKRRARIRRWLEDRKRGLACQRCGENHPACIEFHHRDPAQKEFEVGNAVRLSKGRKSIEAEIAKCDVLCSNCHRKGHYEVKNPLARTIDDD